MCVIEQSSKIPYIVSINGDSLRLMRLRNLPKIVNAIQNTF